MINSKIVIDKETYEKVKARIYADPKALEAIQKTKAITKKYTLWATVLGALVFLISIIVWTIYYMNEENSSTDDASSAFLAIFLTVIEGLFPCLILAVGLSSPVALVGRTQGKKLMKNQVFPLILNALFKGEVQYFENGGVDDGKSLTCSAFFGSEDLEHREGLSGTCLGVPFSCDDVCSPQDSDAGDIGTIIKLRYNKPPKSTIIIADKIRKGGLISVEGPRVELETPEFSKKFYVVDEDKEDAFRVLTPDVQYRFVEVGNLTDAPAIYKIQGDVIEIAFGGQIYNILDFRGAFKEDKDFPNMIKGFLFIESLIKTLGLDNDYWLSVEKNKISSQSDTPLSDTAERTPD